MATYAIGDVQGCFDHLLRLVSKIGFKSDRDQLWFCGDLVNRGPKSVQVLRYVRDLGANAITVLGNHDLQLIATARSGVRDKRNRCLTQVMDAPDGEVLVDWLTEQPFYYYDAALNTAMVHAGIPPGWTRKQTRKRAARLHAHWQSALLGSLRTPPPKHWSGKLDAVDKLRFTCAALTRIRFVDAGGAAEFSAKGHPNNYAGVLRPWFDYLDDDWRETRIVFGHWSTLGSTGRSRVVALDSGCVWGRSLSAVRIDGAAPEDANLIGVECADLVAEPA